MEKLNSLKLTNLSEIQKIRPVELNCNLFSVYDYNGMTLQELICQFYTKLNQVIQNSNEVISLVEYLVNEGLSYEVSVKLEQWLHDGTLAAIINETVFKELNDKLNSTVDEVNKKIEYTLGNSIYNRIGGKIIPISFEERLPSEYDDTERLRRVINKLGIGSVLIDEDIEISTLNIDYDNIGIVIKNAKIICDSINLYGENNVITGYNGVIEGRLKKAYTVTESREGTNTLFFNQHLFNVNDVIYSSYGLTGSKGNGVKVIEVTENIVRVSENVTQTIQAYTTIGNVGWSTLINVNNKNSLIEGVEIRNVRGSFINYNNSKGNIINNVKTFDIGVNQIKLNNSSVDIFNSNLGQIVDVNKSSIVIGKDSNVTIDNCKFNKNNPGDEILIKGDNHLSTTLDIKDSKFFGKVDEYHVGSNRVDSSYLIKIDSTEISTIPRININTSVASDYIVGLISGVENVNNKTLLNEVIFNKNKFYNCLVGDISKLKGVLIFENNIINNNNLDSNKRFITNEIDLKLTFKSNIFENISSQFILEKYVNVIDNHFINCLAIGVNQSCTGDRNIFENSNMSHFPKYEGTFIPLKNNIFLNDEMVTNQKINSYVDFSDYNGVLEFKFFNGTLNGLIYKYAQDILFRYDITRFREPGGFCGSDWFIPMRSKFKIIESNSEHVVTKSVITSVSHDAEFTNYVGLTGTSGVEVGDFINIKSINNTIHTSIVTSVDHANKGILIRDKTYLYKGSNVCVYTVPNIISCVLLPYEEV